MPNDPSSDMANEGDPITEETLRGHRETVIVTGSSGLIGYELCKKLGRTYNVIGFDRPGIPHPPPSTHRIDVDLRSEDSIRAALKDVRDRFGNVIASVIHLAAFYDFSGKASPLYDEITVQGSARLLRQLKPFVVEQFVFVSTELVHAPNEPGRPITERSPLQPKWAYPQSKVKTENLLRAERGHIPLALIRMAGVYDDRCHSIPLAHQIQRINERTLTSHLFPGDLSHGQSFLHLEDAVTLLTLLIAKRRQLEPELVLLAGEPVTLSYETLQKKFGQHLHDEDWKTWRIPKWLAKLGATLQSWFPVLGDPFIKPWMIDLADDHYEMDISRAQMLLGWTPHHSLKDTLPKMIAALARDPERWYKENKLKELKRTRRSRIPPASPRNGTPAQHPPELVGSTPTRN